MKKKYLITLSLLILIGLLLILYFVEIPAPQKFLDEKYNLSIE